MNADAKARSVVPSGLLFLAVYQRLLVFISGPVFQPLIDTHER
jgi:hypothetical protein